MKVQINVPIADLRAEPIHLSQDDFSNNPLRLSQLQLLDRVTILERKGEWLFVEVEDQARFSHELGWHGYRGWIHNNETSSLKNVIQEISPFSRESLIQEALKYIDFPYLWGGTSFFSEHPKGSVDCSGLTYLSFKKHGILIPRDAHDQYLYCQKIEKQDLQPGDLIFWTPVDKKDRVTHVVFYLNSESYLEAPETGKKVRILPLPKDFFKPQESYQFPDRTKNYLVNCGSVTDN